MMPPIRNAGIFRLPFPISCSTDDRFITASTAQLERDTDRSQLNNQRSVYSECFSYRFQIAYQMLSLVVCIVKKSLNCDF